MEMKNKYYKYSRLSEQKFQSVVESFALDRSATEAAAATQLSVRAVNSIYLKLRRRIGELCERVPSSEMATQHSDGSHWPVQGEVFGVRVAEGRICCELIPGFSRTRLQARPAELASSSWLSPQTSRATWDVLVDLELKHRVCLHTAASSDLAAAFLDFAKARLQKFNGIARHTFHLHLKETEFRFNHKGENIANLLLASLAQNPLEFSSPTLEATGEPSQPRLAAQIAA
jgi:transposase